MGEYLKALEERKRQYNKENVTTPKIGSIVLLKDDVKNKANWRIARRVNHIYGRDGVIRGFKLKLGNGYIIDRPVQLVCDLEIGGEESTVRLNSEAPAFMPRGPRDEPVNRAMTRKAKSTAKEKIIGIALKEEDSEEE